ncbi:hypothetical protein DEO72_LG3g898 [Vigna unguiculata]|uniref:Transposase n=1 Tax=Vigna unguiculata TaxID=3917 RepID=A0A4D6LCS5_VIGUN|nr:hypothetical protein DEO72_LG3g898 [Vigna unguiculata]
MSSSSDRVSLSSSSSERSGGSGSSKSDSSDREELGNVGRIPMERIVEVREDPPEELAESSWSVKTGYKWVVANGARRDIVVPERVTVVECVCHGRDGAVEEFFYMYMCHFSQLHIRLLFDEFTMGVLRLLNVAPTQLHPNSWAYLQAFRLLYGFFKVVIKQVGCSHFYIANGNTKFPFFWTGNPWRYKVMAREELSVADKEVVDAVMLFSDKMPTKGLIRVYNLVHPIIDIEGHMAHMGKKNLTVFQTFQKEKATRARAAGNTEVPNLQESLVDVHVHGGTKRRAELPAKPGKGKDVKKVRSALMGPGSSSGARH